MTGFVCTTCGTQFAPSVAAPDRCPICEDERQYVGLDGQQWTTLESLRTDYHNEFVGMEPKLTAIFTKPEFAIGQRAFLLQSAGGNVLWDCLTLIDSNTRAAIQALGGLSAIAISHPHYYSSMVEWAHHFNVPVYLHAADREWVMRHDPLLRFWDSETLELHDGITLIRGGGHFAGGTMLHWPAGAEGRGALLSGDIIQVVLDRRWVSFMYSYPNLIPLNPATVRRLAATVAPFEFVRIYGAFHPRQVESDAKRVLQQSVERYIRHLQE